MTLKGMFGRRGAHSTSAPIPHVSAQVAAIIRLQLLTGMRPGEVLIMRTGDLDRTGEIWIYIPSHHKTAHHAHQRTVYLGPKATGDSHAISERG